MDELELNAYVGSGLLRICCAAAAAATAAKKIKNLLFTVPSIAHQKQAQSCEQTEHCPESLLGLMLFLQPEW